MTDPWADLPECCFVSHSYQDSNVVTEMEKKAKKRKLMRFQRVEPDPGHAVSDGIVTKILDCDALIYLRGGASESSFWVSFERDYALRAGRAVYAYTPTEDVLVRDRSRPLDLDLRVMFHREDKKRISTLFKWMKNKRHVDLEEGTSRTRTGGISGDFAYQMEELLVEGGPVLWLGSQRLAIPMASFAVEMVAYLSDNSTDFRESFIESQLDGHTRDRDLQDQPYIAEANEQFYSEMDPYIFTPEIAVRIDPNLSRSWQPPGGALLDLLREDNRSFNWNRIDDLIIRLYAALLQQRRRRMASPPQSSAVSVEHLDLLVTFWDENPAWTGRVRVGASRNPQGTQIAQKERWWLGRWDGQMLFDDCVKLLNQRFGLPIRISRLPYAHLLFDRDLAPAFAVVWPVDPAIVVLSLVFEGPYSMVFLRRYDTESVEGGRPLSPDQEPSGTTPRKERSLRRRPTRAQPGVGERFGSNGQRYIPDRLWLSTSAPQRHDWGL